MSKDTNSLAHTKWNCKYHIVFAPKYRRQVIYRKLKKDIGEILRTLCERKGVEIIEATACKDHVHMLVSIPPKISVSSFVGYLKGKSSLITKASSRRTNHPLSRVVLIGTYMDNFLARSMIDNNAR